MIDRGDIRQRNWSLQQYLASLPGAGYGQFEHKADSLIAKNSVKGRNGQREIDVWAESPRLSPPGLSASSSACRWLLTTVDNAITYKAQRENARELKLANAAITGGRCWVEVC